MNLLKLNDGWRAILRQTRSAELHDDIVVLRQTFERQLDGVDSIIKVTCMMVRTWSPSGISFQPVRHKKLVPEWHQHFAGLEARTARVRGWGRSQIELVSLKQEEPEPASHCWISVADHKATSKETIRSGVVVVVLAGKADTSTVM